MATTINNSFRTQWSDDVAHAVQQKKSRLRPAVRVVRNVEGDTFKFNRLEKVAANTKSRNADLTFIDASSEVATATLTDHYAPIPLDFADMDKVGKNLDMRREYVEAGAGALNRQTDTLVVSAMAAGHGGSSTTASAGFTASDLMNATQFLNEGDAEIRERFYVCSPAVITAALSIDKLTSADYNNLLAVQRGEIRQALGLTWIMSNQLGGSAGSRPTYVFQKDAVGLAIGTDVHTDIDKHAKGALWVINSWMSMGAVTIDTGGVYVLRVIETDT